MNKLLIITYYWPPSGGAGVQRWVKLSKYLSEYPAEIHILTVDPLKASYLQRDDSLLADVSTRLQVHTTDSFEIIRLYERMVGRKNVPTSGFSNVDMTSFRNRAVNFIRSHLFIPDPRRGWNRFALKKARQLIRAHGISTVITTSPPHSTQLIGLSLQKTEKLRWIADIRDPWTDIYYYPLLQHSFFSKQLDTRYEGQVLRKADKLITVSERLKDLLQQKRPNRSADDILVLPNGYDPEDFDGLTRNTDPQTFTICYTGSMADSYKPDNFILALADFIYSNHVPDIRLVFIGSIAQGVLNKVKAMKLDEWFTHLPAVPHNEVNQYQLNATLLLLLIPETENEKAILTGKLFEYLATGNPILAIGPTDGDAAAIIEACRAGKTFDREDFKGIKQFLIQSYLKYMDKVSHSSDADAIRTYDRKNQARELYTFLYRDEG